MIKHLGPVIVWIVLAGVVLYVIRHGAELIGGVSAMQHLFK